MNQKVAEEVVVYKIKEQNLRKWSRAWSSSYLKLFTEFRWSWDSLNKETGLIW